MRRLPRQFTLNTSRALLPARHSVITTFPSFCSPGIKGNRDSRLKGPLFNMASESKPPLLAAPLEIRHEIYRYAWTIPIDAKKHFEPRFPSCLNKSYFKLQVGQLHTLVSICGQMRDEVLAEYFPRTQVYLRWHYGQLSFRRRRNIPRPEFDAIRYIQSSRLLTHYTHHVSLQWEPCLCSRNSEGRQTNCQHLDWLLKLEQLKTLELVISHGWIYIIERLRVEVPESNLGLKAEDVFCSVCFSKLMKLRNLEKVVFKVLFDNDPTVAQKHEVERSNWFARTKKQVSDMILKAPNQGEQQPRDIIERHIGAVNAKWPRCFKI